MPARLLLPPEMGPKPAEPGSFPLTVIPSQAEQITLVDGEAVACNLCLQALSAFAISIQPAQCRQRKELLLLVCPLRTICHSASMAGLFISAFDCGAIPVP